MVDFLKDTLLRLNCYVCLYKKRFCLQVTYNANILKAKKAFLDFCNHFAEIPREKLLNDSTFGTYFKLLMENDTILYRRAFQLAIEVTYSKRKFSTRELLAMFDNNYYSIVDPITANSSPTIDSSTLYTALQTNLLVQRSPFRNSTIVINSTPTTNIDHNNLPALVKKKIAISKATTGNTFTDLSLDDVPYDFKDERNPSKIKNHILIYDYDVLAHKGESLLQDVYNALRQKVHSVELNKTIMSKSESQFLVENKKKLENILQSKSTIFEKLHAWNTYIQKNLHMRPTTFTTPIIIQSTEKPFIPEDSLLEKASQVDIQDTKIDVMKARKAIMGILDNKPRAIKENAQLSSHSVLSFNVDDDDINS